VLVVSHFHHEASFLNSVDISYVSGKTNNHKETKTTYLLRL